MFCAPIATGIYLLVVDSSIKMTSSHVAFFFFSSRRRHTRWPRDWSSDVCSSDLEWAKVSLITPDDYPRASTRSGREGVAGFDATTISRLLSVYEDVKTDRHVIDFEDVLLLMVGILAERDDVADTVRRQYRHFVVDEFQDVSPLQHRLLSLWLGDRKELCVVGDAAQTIYSFTGATSRYLTTFSRSYPEAPVIRLVRDYRSTPQVVSLANAVLSRAGRHRSPSTVELQAQRAPGPAAGYTAYDDDQAEATGVAAHARRLIDSGVPASEIAVLYRTNAQSEGFEQALSAAGIGYLVRGGERFFSRKEVKDAVVLLRGAARSQADVPLPDAVRDVLTGAGWAPEPPAARGAQRPDLVAELLERASAQHAPTVDGVTLASLHAAKGLEWDAVFLVGVSDGLLPISMAETDEAIAEERRLLYVGITRAREHLQLSYARARNVGGRGSRRHSRFLDGLWPVEHTPTPQRRRSRAGRADALATALTENDADPEVFERLRAWRAATAQEIDKPAFTVLHDSTLIAIAAAQPTQLRQLALLRGIGPTKLEAYGAQILAVVRGEDPVAPAG